MNRRAFLQLGGATLGASVLGTVFYGCEFERHDVEVAERAIALPGLGDAFHGMRVVQISDLHYDEFTEPYYIRDVVTRVNALKPDVVLMTGDFVSYGPMPKSFGARHAGPCAAVLANLQCPIRYAILGNHDAEIGPALVAGALEEHGIPVLQNQFTPLERDGKRLWIAGVGDVTERLARLERAIPPKRVRGDEPVILMVHEPDFADHVSRYVAFDGGAELMLSGHSHGGQVRLPFVGALVLPPLGQKYSEGFYQVGRTRLYVNRGIGTVGLPVRFLCRPEITVFTLSAA